MLIIFYTLSQHSDDLVDIYFEKDQRVFKILFETNKRYSEQMQFSVCTQRLHLQVNTHFVPI